jgi:GTP-binding protein
MQKADREFMQFLGRNKLPFVLVFTKTDKLTSSQLKRNIDQYKTSMLQRWESLPDTFQTSALNKTGRQEILGFIQTVMQEE